MVTRAEKLTILIQFEITRPVAAIKSLRFALLLFISISLDLYVKHPGPFYLYEFNVSMVR